MSGQYLYLLEAVDQEAADRLLSMKCPGFAGFDLAGDILDFDLLCKKAMQRRSLLFIHDLIDRRLAAMIPEESLAMRMEFSRVFRQRCHAAARLGVRAVGVQFDLTRAMNEAEYGRKFALLLRGCYGILEEFKLELRLPCRFPGGPSAPRLESYAALVRRLLYPRVRLSIEFHPHEAGALTAPAGTFAPLRFCREYWTLQFDAANGNQLTAAALAKWQEIAAQEEPESWFVTLAPGAADTAAIAELSQLLQAAP